MPLMQFYAVTDFELSWNHIVKCWSCVVVLFLRREADRRKLPPPIFIVK